LGISPGERKRGRELGSMKEKERGGGGERVGRERTRE